MHNKHISKSDQSYADQVRFVKSEAKRRQKRNPDKRRKTHQNDIARALGHKGYDELKDKLSAEIRLIVNKGRQECLARMPVPDKNYYFVTALNDFKYDVYSHWVAWDHQGYELRAASQVRPEWAIKFVRESLLEPLYIIHTEAEFWSYMFNWKGRALVDVSIADEEMPSLSQASISYAHTRKLIKDDAS